MFFMATVFNGSSLWCVSDRRGRALGQAGAEEGSHRAADGPAQVQEESPAPPGLRQPLRRHRDEGPSGLRDQQVPAASAHTVCESLSLLLNT